MCRNATRAIGILSVWGVGAMGLSLRHSPIEVDKWDGGFRMNMDNGQGVGRIDDGTKVPVFFHVIFIGTAYTT